MVLELFRRPLGSDPSALVQRFVEDAFSVESATVVAGWDTRTVSTFYMPNTPLIRASSIPLRSDLDLGSGSGSSAEAPFPVKGM